MKRKDVRHEPPLEHKLPSEDTLPEQFPLPEEYMIPPEPSPDQNAHRYLLSFTAAEKTIRLG